MTMNPLRFQVNKRVESALAKKHPWIYRDQCSSALAAIPVGSLVRAVGTRNQFLGIGLYEPLSSIAIRLFCFEDRPLDGDYFRAALLKAYEKRLPRLQDANTNAFRWIHGESDGFPGLAIDIYDAIGVVVPYLESWVDIAFAELITVAQSIGLQALYLKPPHGAALSPGLQKKLGAPASTNGSPSLWNLFSKRFEALPEPIRFAENGHCFLAYPASGIKTGFFLDLREVRSAIAAHVSPGDRVLNLFANDGALSALALKAGAKAAISVEENDPAATRARALFSEMGFSFCESDWIRADVWKYLNSPQDSAPYDIAIVDPPSLASKKGERDALSRVWTGLHTPVIRQMKSGGTLFSISCTERLSREVQLAATERAALYAGKKIHLLKILPKPFDHPGLPSLPERDYLRAAVWRVV